MDKRKQKQLKRLLTKNDAEFLLEEVSNGRFKIRIGQVWQMPRLRGRTILLLDHDNVRRISVRNIRTRLGQCAVRVLRIQCRRSPSGTGYHVLVWIAGVFSNMARIAMQSILESDAAREAQNFKRLMQRDYRWKDEWQVLFKKGKKK